MWVASQGKQHCRFFRNSPGKSGASCVPVWELLDRNHSDDLCNLCIISLFLVCFGPAVQMYGVFAFQTRLIVRRLRERRTHAVLERHQVHHVCCLRCTFCQLRSGCPGLSWRSGAGWVCCKGVCYRVPFCTSPVLPRLWNTSKELQGGSAHSSITCSCCIPVTMAKLLWFLPSVL